MYCESCFRNFEMEYPHITREYSEVITTEKCSCGAVAIWAKDTKASKEDK